jgi:hypothetical protein
VAREQRKLATIVAADVVGYSRLMGHGESGTLVRLAAISLRIVAGRFSGAAAAGLPSSHVARMPIRHGPRQRPTSALYSEAMINARATK